jgi:hypothetical protein
MAHNLSSVPRPRRSRTTATDGTRQLVSPGPVAAAGASPAPQDDRAPDDELGTVLGWLRRCTGDDAVADDLAVEVFRRRAEPGPAFLDRAPADLRLRYLVTVSVLKARGTL